MMMFEGFIVLAVVLWFTGALRPKDGTATGSSSVESILAQRLASGEIDANEYEARLQLLRGAK